MLLRRNQNENNENQYQNSHESRARDLHNARVIKHLHSNTKTWHANFQLRTGAH